MTQAQHYPHLLLVLTLIVLASCDRNGRKEPAANKDSGDTSGMVDTVTAMPISETAMRKLLAEGSKLYWGIPAAATTEKIIIDEEDMVRVDPGKYPTLKALREKLSPIFTSTAVDEIIDDFSINERDGKLWMIEGDGGDVRVYDEAAVLESGATADSLNLTVEIPLGDSGQTDVVDVELVRVGDKWKIASDPYGGDDNDEE